MLRRISVVASLAVTAAMFVGVTSAQADPSGSAACVFDGLSGVLDPEISHEPASGGEGTYNFTGHGDCAGVVGDTTLVPEGDEDGNVTISSDGHYDNIHCGTGFAHDASTTAAPTTTVTPNGGGDTIADIEYEIFFHGGNGNLRIGIGPSIAPDDSPGQLGGHWQGDGDVQIIPQNQDPEDFGCVNAPVQQFLVDGSFAADHV